MSRIVGTARQAVILEEPKYPHNLAAAIRACACFGLDRLYWTGSRFTFEAGDRLPREERMKGYANVKFENVERPFDHLAIGTVPVCVELTPCAMPLTFFEHPPNAAYVFGPEDGGVSQAFRGLCHYFVYIPAYHCLNLAAAVNVVLADRLMKTQLAGNLRAGPATDLLNEHRGSMEIPEVCGWDGK